MNKVYFLIFAGILIIFGIFSIQIREPWTTMGDISSVSKTPESCHREFSPQFSTKPYYTGQFFDAHFHLPPTFEMTKDGFRFPILNKDIGFREILCLFDKEKTRGAIIFFEPDEMNLKNSIKNLRELKDFAKDYEFRWFLTPRDLVPETIREIIEENEGLFRGIGEMAFYELPGKTPSDVTLSQIYRIAEKHNLVVMLHPARYQNEETESALRENPNVKFLIHGYETESSIPSLIARYDNVYYSLDSANLFLLSPRDKFISYFRGNFDSILSRKVSKWKELIERYPTRFLLGTDRFVDWQFDEEAIILTEEFFRAFVGRLNVATQDQFAYKNAKAIFNQ